ncbi:MAG: VWA domain-containing protein [Gemmatimonas sp.]
MRDPVYADHLVSALLAAVAVATATAPLASQVPTLANVGSGRSISAHAPTNLVPCEGSGSASDVIVFINGVYNSKADALASCADLGRRLIDGGLSSSRLMLFYNRSQLDAWRDCETAARVADEVRGQTGADVPRQLVVRPFDGTRTLGSGPANYASIPAEALRRGCLQSDDLVEAAYQFSNIVGGFKSTSQADATGLAVALDDLLADPQRRVSVVSHSQGNLLVQEALFGAGTPVDANERLRIGWVSVSAPYLESSPAIGAFTSVVLPGDPIRALRNAAEPTEAEGWRRFTQSSQHFFSTYLAADETRFAIVDGVRGFLGESIAMIPSVPTSPAAGAATRTLLILDLSSSMDTRLPGSGTRISAAKAAARYAVNSLPQGVEIGLLTFGGACEVTKVLSFTSDRQRVLSAVDGLRTQGKTPLVAAMRAALNDVRALSAPETTSVVIVTDGLESCGGEGDVETIARELGAALKILR